MRRAIIIGIAALGIVLAGLLVWRPWEMTPERWIRTALKELQQMPPPPADFAASLGDGEWAGQRYLLFTNGWACFSYHTFHASERVGDIGLLRASDGSLYIAHFHFCVGLTEYSQRVLPSERQQPRPRDMAHFIELYGPKHGWKRLQTPKFF
jgi:hypothetical protein